ncbi:MAG TPA: S8 family serine peptidase [Vicinamibacterales bacterium]
MKRWLFAGVCAAAATVLLTPNHHLLGQGATIRERSQTPGSPGVLARVGDKRLDRLTIDAGGATLPAQPDWAFDPVTGVEYRRGELLVRFREGASSSARSQALRAVGGARRPVALAANWEVVQLSGTASTTAALASIRRDPNVQDVSLNYRLTGQQVRPNDEYYNFQWNFDAINLPAAWAINPGARNDVTVAVIDTGLNTGNETFTFFTPIGQIPIRFSSPPDMPAGTRIVKPFDFVYRDDFPVDLDGHGTHVAGTVAQETNNSFGAAGVAYNVNLMPLKVLGSDWDDVLIPSNPGGSTALVAEAIRYAADNGAKVINLSLGGRGASTALRDAITYAVSRGAFVAMAAGNEGDEGNPTEYPAAYAREIEGAMTVGAINRARQRADYSGFHPYVEICAPGGETRGPLDYDEGITQVSYDEDFSLTYLSPIQMILALQLGLRPQFDRFMMLPKQGTSMATPHVAGVAALLYSQGIRNPRAIEQAIKRFAAPISATPDECGAGLVDARRALRGLGLSR